MHILNWKSLCWLHSGHYRTLLVKAEDRSPEVLRMKLPENKQLNIEIFEQKSNF